MQTHPEPLPIGAPAPSFQLPGVDGKDYRFEDFAAPLLVYIQGCNHCPIVLAYLERIKAYARDYAPRGVDFVMVNSNDVDKVEDDSFPAMKAFSAKHQLPFPYLYDESQEVARAYRTFRTPEVLVFDRERKLCYHGRIDDNAKEPEQASSFEFKEALDALLDGQPVPVPETYAVGCTVKWKPGNEPVLV